MLARAVQTGYQGVTPLTRLLQSLAPAVQGRQCLQRASRRFCSTAPATGAAVPTLPHLNKPAQLLDEFARRLCHERPSISSSVRASRALQAVVG